MVNELVVLHVLAINLGRVLAGLQRADVTRRDVAEHRGAVDGAAVNRMTFKTNLGLSSGAGRNRAPSSCTCWARPCLGKLAVMERSMT